MTGLFPSFREEPGPGAVARGAMSLAGTFLGRSFALRVGAERLGLPLVGGLLARPLAGGLLALQLAGGLLALAACGPVASKPVAGLVEGAFELAQREVGSGAVDAAPRGGAREIVRTDDVTQSARFEADARELVLESWTRVDGAYQRIARRLEFASPIEAVAASRPWELVVALREQDGAIVLQRWFVRAPSLGSTDDVEDAVAVHSTLLRTYELSGVRLLACDPDGRYVLALDRAGERVFQCSLNPRSTWNARFEAERLPALRSACGLFFGRHIRNGTVWAFEASGSEGVARAALVDRDGDGVIDELVDYDAEEWAASEFGDAAWAEERFVAAR